MFAAKPFTMIFSERLPCSQKVPTCPFHHGMSTLYVMAYLSTKLYMQELGVDQDLYAYVFGESVLNDAVSILMI